MDIYNGTIVATISDSKISPANLEENQLTTKSTNTQRNRFCRFLVDVVWVKLCYIANCIIEFFRCTPIIERTIDKEKPLLENNIKVNFYENSKITIFMEPKDETAFMEPKDGAAFMEPKDETACDKNIILGHLNWKKIDKAAIEKLKSASANEENFVEHYCSFLNIDFFNKADKEMSETQKYLEYCFENKEKPFFIADNCVSSLRQKNTDKASKSLENDIKTLSENLGKRNTKEKRAVEKVLEYIIMINRDEYLEKFPTSEEFLTCLSSCEKHSKNLEKRAKDFILINGKMKNTTALDKIFLKRLVNHIKNIGDNPLLLELHAGNGYLAKELNTNGLTTISTDACLSNIVDENLMQDVFFSFGHGAIKDFSQLVSATRDNNIPLSPIIISSAPGGSAAYFFESILDALKTIENLTVIIIGKSRMDKYTLKPIDQNVQCTELTKILSYSGKSDPYDKVYTYKLKK